MLLGGLVDKAQLDLGLREALDEFIDGVESAADDAVAAHLRAVLRRCFDSFAPARSAFGLRFGAFLSALPKRRKSLWTSRPM